MARRGTHATPLEERIANLDVSLFGAIESLTTSQDRRSLLALHDACAGTYGTFDYLEIGSYHGGSLQALVRDSRCGSIVSIDTRPPRQPDQRGADFANLDNSTDRMLERLSAIPDADVEKITALDADTRTLDPERVPGRPVMCFIDGEHTDETALHDARFCRRVLADSGSIVFHDGQIIYRGIANFIEQLRAGGVVFQPYVLPDSLFVIELGEPRLLAVEQVAGQLEDSWQAYLWSLQFNDGYRRALSTRVAQALRRARVLRVELGRHR